jgi:class 3 adenylate cyclase/tetratricopeptide (TPR) repeat protein
MRCSRCGADIQDTANFCDGCGAPIKAQCSSCGALNRPGARFCSACGAAVSCPSAESPAPLLTTPVSDHFNTEGSGLEAPEGERKTVTALFADINGSTELERDLDPEDARAIVDPVLQLMIAAVHRYDGYVAQSTGDGIFALFGAPIAHEDHAQRALYAALAMQRELHRHSERLKSQGRSPVEIRIGANTGEVVMRTIHTGGHPEYTPVGHVTNLASRMQTTAPIGGIAISEDTRRLVEGYFELRALGPTTIKGLAEPVEVYEVTGLGPLRTHFDLAARRGLTKFIGREAELAQMQRALELACSGNGQLVAVVAEAGTGKSRLFYEFKATLPGECKLLEAYSVSHGKASAWLPVLELLHRYLSIESTDNPSARQDKVRAKLSALDPALSDTLPYLFALLGIAGTPDPLTQMDPQIKRQRTLDAIKRIFLRESLAQPLIVIFEDLHWIDDHTQALVDLLADGIGNARIFLLVNYRPEYRHKWGSKSYYTQLRLGALDREGAAAMLTALLGDELELAPLKRLIVERTEGNPFFIEEMVQALFGDGALVRNGEVKVARSLSQLRLPPTVQGLLAARIDRLRSEHKQLLQTLAVLGRESPLTLIKALGSGGEQEVERILADLQSSEFVYEQPVATGVQYIFKHALTQEVAYNSILIERRKALHERAGQALESIFSDRLDDHLNELAHHYSHSNNISKAVEYLGRAGQQASKRSAHAEAKDKFTTAIDLLPRLPETPERTQRELHLRLGLGMAFTAAKGYSAPEVEQAFTLARELCEDLGEPRELFAVLNGLFSFHYLQGQLTRAYELAQEIMERARKTGNETSMMAAQNNLGHALLSMGRLAPALENLETAASLYDPQRHRALRFTPVNPGVHALSYSGIALGSLGYPSQALKRTEDALILAKSLSNPQSLAFAEYFFGEIRLSLGDTATALEATERVIALAAEHGFAFWLSEATRLRAWVLFKQGLTREVISQLQEGMTDSATSAGRLGRPEWLTRLAHVYVEAGLFDDALSALAKALAITNQNGERIAEAWTHQTRGEVLLRRDRSNVGEAQRCFERSIEIARSQSAKLRELRATMSFARLLATLDRRDEACAMVGDIYNWFSEGFDTPLLKDAKALLDELSR